VHFFQCHAINLDLLRNMLLGFKSACKQIVPKVNPTLIADIIERQQENPEPIYMLEVFTKAGVDSEKIRNLLLEKVGVTPEVYDMVLIMLQIKN
jgi:hypothetical protein